jgi:hypothetical protein
MTVETKDLCPICKGTRWRLSADKARPCVCLLQEMLDNYLGPDLSGAARIRESPLYAIDGDFTSTRDRTNENLFIKSSWPVLLPHLRLAIGHRHHRDATFRFTILTDERIINVYVGNESYKARSGRSAEGNFNGLKDLVESADLVVVRLGFLGHKNVAAPGALKQALMIREAALKPTWVVQNPVGDHPVSWNEEVAAYLVEHFDVIDMRKMPAPQQPEARPTMEVEEAPQAPAKVKVKVAPDPPPDLMPTHDDDPFGMTREGSSRPGGRRNHTWKKKRPGNGNDSGGGDMPPI